MSNDAIKEMNKLIESVKIANNSSVYIFCYKEYEEVFKEHFKEYEILIIPDRFESNESDKNIVYIMPKDDGTL